LATVSIAAVCVAADRPKHNGVSIANVAVRYILEQPTVAGAIVGARLSISEHIAENAKVFDFALERGG
jgi:aryl-alcohol dehydrogenase-like predicted oxidoreductase